MRVAITGAASGIGAATADLLKRRGAEITAFDIADPTTHADEWIKLDFNRPENISDAANQATGPFDALLNIAGIPPRGDNVVDVLTINWLSLKRFADGFEKHLAPGASIVNLASRAGSEWKTNIEQVRKLHATETVRDIQELVANDAIDATRAYCLSKEALIVWTKQETERLNRNGLRMNCISPSAVDTAILSDFVAALGARAEATIERVGRPGQPGDIAPIAAFLASPESAWLRGVDIEADGGITAMVAADNL